MQAEREFLTKNIMSLQYSPISSIKILMIKLQIRKLDAL